MNLSNCPDPTKKIHAVSPPKPSPGGDMFSVARITLLLASIALIGLTPIKLAAQNLSGPFAGFATDSNAPINIESDSLEVNDAKKTAVFRGNVVAVQGDMEMRTPELEVTYSGQVAGSDAAGPTGKGTQLTRLRAKKKVLLTSQKNQTAKSDWADFDVKKQVIVIGSGLKGLNRINQYGSRCSTVRCDRNE